MIFGQRTLRPLMNLAQGNLTSITWKTFSNAINRLAWWLTEQLGVPECQETLCYIGPSDVRYFIFAVAACKAGYKALFSSPRNQLAAHISLLEATTCHTLIGVNSPIVEEVLNNTPLAYLAIPSLHELLDPQLAAPFDYHKTFEQNVQTPFLILHTSGSTGLPKPVTITHGLISSMAMHRDLEPIEGRYVTSRHYADVDMYTALPPFHVTAGINFLGFSVYHGTRLILGPSEKIPSLGILQQMLDRGFAQAGVVAPSILEEAATSPEILQRLSSWGSVSFGGGPLSRQAGDILSKHTRVLNLLGSTETNNLPELTPASPEDWPYHEFHPSLGIDFRHHSGNLYELVLLRQPEDALYHAPFYTFPELQEYPMKDLYAPHPTKTGLWLYQGRADDIVVLANGEKFNPVEAEKIISSHPEIKSALIVGAAKDQAAVLIEPIGCSPQLGSNDTEDSVWSVIVKANESLPGHAKVDRAHSMILDSSDIFLRSTKGTVQRRPTLDKLGDEIEHLYQNADRSAPSCKLDSKDVGTLRDSIVAAMSVVGLRKGSSIQKDDNFFSYGFDSLQTIRLAKIIQGSMETEVSSSVLKTLIYNNATIEGLANGLLKLEMFMDGYGLDKALYPIQSNC
ncbi:acetyl-CoA synthetase-like protein [Aureobasidium pullulans]|nr:acetyl-CoA synthetase-like protein [Aureobasidium pullulans]